MAAELRRPGTSYRGSEGHERLGLGTDESAQQGSSPSTCRGHLKGPCMSAVGRGPFQVAQPA